MAVKEFEQVLVHESGQAVVIAGHMHVAGGVGFRGEVSASWYAHPGEWYLNRAIIPAECRGRGLGTQLLKRLLEVLSAKENFVHVIVEPGGYGADINKQRRFYTKNGFKPVRAFNNVYQWTKRETDDAKDAKELLGAKQATG
jgi:ribosomal protein S18 acetylase RimI-like enzyme